MVGEDDLLDGGWRIVDGGSYPTPNQSTVSRSAYHFAEVTAFIALQVGIIVSCAYLTINRCVPTEAWELEIGAVAAVYEGCLKHEDWLF